MKYLENVVIGKPLVDPSEIFAFSQKDWEEVEKPKTLFTEQRSLANILKDIGVVPSVSEVRRNKPNFMRTLNELGFFEVKWGKKRVFILVGE